MNQLPKRDRTRMEKKKKKKNERFCLQITTVQIGLNTQERQNQVKKKERFCLQITTAHIVLTTQERQNQVNRGTKQDENKKKKNTGSSFAEIGQVIKD